MKKDYSLGIVYIILMGIGFPITRFLSLNLAVVVNNGVRLLSGGILLLVIIIFKFREELKKLIYEPILIFKLLLLVCFLSTNMYFGTEGIKNTSALAASIFGILAIPLAVITTSIFFEDEREKVKDKNFFIGSILALAGSLIFVLYGSQGGESSNFLKGSIFLGTAICIQSVQNLVVKSVAKKLNALVMTTIISILSGILYLSFAIQRKEIFQLKEINQGLLIFLVLAGIYGVLSSMLIPIRIMQTQGVVVFNMFRLLVPLSTAVAAYFTLGEKINLYQGLGAIIVVLGCVLATRKKY
ncbi:MAG: DMT family transporter [Fusobacterium sp.]|nr:DMT family transporter [Fusobacterium sp.]